MNFKINDVSTELEISQYETINLKFHYYSMYKKVGKYF